MTNDTPPAIYASPSPDSTLENILTAEMLVDDVQTWAILRNGGVENDPFTRSMTHSPLAMLAGTLVTSVAIRLFPHSAAKTTALKVIVGAEGANLGANVRVLIMMGK